MPSRKRTAVLIHGCHLQANLAGLTWTDIVWGPKMEAPNLFGRATMGLKIAFEESAELVIFSTGASERAGIKEGEYTLNYAHANCARIASSLDVRESVLKRFLRKHAELDLESQNTRQECERNFRLCAARSIQRVILVSSPWHIQRCLTEALKVAESMRQVGETVPEIVATASHGSTEGIVIFEPSHRGDQPKNRFAELGLRFFAVPTASREDFERALDKLLHDHDAV